MRITAACLLALLVAGPIAAAQGDAALAAALRAAVQPGLPFPAAGADGTPVGGSTEPLWTVRWPADDPQIEVLANPLNPRNRRRALEAEEQIQQAAMRAQQRSQADYEKALSDFERTGRTSAIREISLRDDGVAGERYDAESQLAISARTVSGVEELTFAAAELPRQLAAPSGVTALLRLEAHVYEERSAADELAEARFSAAQAWVVLGDAETPAITREGDTAIRLRIAPRAATSAGRVVVVTLSGNPSLIDQVLQKADWTALKTLTGG